MATEPRWLPELRASLDQQSPRPSLPRHFGRDYQEARLILAASPRASAALSRICLQRLLREKAGAEPGDLAIEIESVVSSGELPLALAGALSAVRSLGKFFTYPLKSRAPGTILHVDPGEAEWLLAVLEKLLLHYFGASVLTSAGMGEPCLGDTRQSEKGAA